MMGTKVAGQTVGRDGMPFSPVEPEKISAAVVRQVELLILRGILRPGERLPAERDLAERLGVSRPSLREAIAELETRGLLARRAGAGIFVADVLGSAFSPALVRLFSAHDEAVFDTIAFRRDMEGLAAERAARLGSDTDLAVIDTIFGKMEAAHSKRSGADEAALDAEFHMAIVEASHNVIMLHMMRSMYDLLREGVFYNRQMMFRRRTTRAALLAQHRAINDALQARDAAAARSAVAAHLDYVEQALVESRKAERNETVARQRLEHETRR
jgi:GntR family transcriptional repressor for pyruvate dehydrogenase complex